ncbi:putative lipoprotein [Streptomyces albireticuli]|uniref:Putative lipoprotein n=1 Tax=Streptomyces albireticuli TaxID=1940 RepID=A0A1Z2L088_9ACTN|nr:hypothetical protein [Streptomyces albireticuli]ARZ67708.1 putative lipoprotein [Streptomyces albireticuli]
MKAIQKTFLAATGAVLALTLTACGGGGSEHGGGTAENGAKADTRDPYAVLKAARQKVAQQNSYKTKRLSKDSEGQERVEYAFSRKPDLTDKKSWDQPRKPKDNGLDNYDQMVGTEDALFTRNAGLAGGRWLRTDVKDKAAEKEATRKGEIQKRAEGELPNWLGVLGSSKGVTKAGEETVGGKPATHFKGTVVLDELERYKGDAMRDWLREAFVEERRKRGLAKVDIDVWIGRDDLPVKGQESGKDSKGTRDMTEEYTDYGVDPKIQVPVLKDSITLDQFAQEAYDKGASGAGTKG